MSFALGIAVGSVLGGSLDTSSGCDNSDHVEVPYLMRNCHTSITDLLREVNRLALDKSVTVRANHNVEAFLSERQKQIRKSQDDSQLPVSLLDKMNNLLFCTQHSWDTFVENRKKEN